MLDISDAFWAVQGIIVCTDETETWLECLIDNDGDRYWLAVEARAGLPCCTLWRRIAAPAGEHTATSGPWGEPGEFVETERGEADFTAAGTFDDIVVPRRGRLEYIEYAAPSGRRAAERLAPHLPWLIGTGSGAPVAAKICDGPTAEP